MILLPDIARILGFIAAGFQYLSPVNFITLTTDFSLGDWFAGTMKGVILGIAPDAAIVDITHEIPPGDIRAGAFALAVSRRFFPKGTVHVCVVDPGVGSARKGIAAQTDNGFFVGPDNGVLSWALALENIRSIRQLENERYFLRPVIRTFHGRDIFAPVGAHLSRGLPIRKLGPPVEEFVRLSRPQPRQTSNTIHGEVVYIDRFGNCITNIPNDPFQGIGARTALSAGFRSPNRADKGVRTPRADSWAVFTKGKPICPVAPSYQSVRMGLPVAVPGSSGFLEIAVNGSSAARRLGLKVGGPVEVRARR
jgi:hypothetical protein